MAVGDLITLEELLDATNKLVADLEPEDIRKHELALTAASVAIKSFADRDFGSSAVSEEREYEDDGSGWIEIDDATAVSTVKQVRDGIERPLGASEWRALPHRGPVYTDVRVPAGGFYTSPEMGFMENLDTYYSDRPGGVPFVRVTATWGWPDVPADVKRAVIWAAINIMDISKPQAESIAGYSKSQGRVVIQESAIPERAQALLAPYIRLKV